MQRAATVFAFFIVAITASYAQSVKEILKNGEVQYNAKKYDQALATYLEGLKTFPQDAKLNFQTGLTYLSLPNKSKSLTYLQKAFTINQKVDKKIYYYLGVSYHSNRQFQKAEEFFKEYKKRNKEDAALVDEKLRQIAFADSLTKHPTPGLVENVGKVINSSFHEFSPLVSADGNTMIFTSNRADGKNGAKGVGLYEHIYISKRTNNIWSQPVKISPNINIRFNDAAASLSPDGKTLVLYYEYGGGDIYISKLKGKEWTKPVPLNSNVNTPGFWETSAFLTADGKKLYFTSNRPGGVGSLDIYVSEMELTGDWGRATNLGPVINTPGREDSPALDRAGTTLYFSSNGHQTMGGSDIFKSEFKDGRWQKPVNMGYPVNSVEDDSFFSISEDHRRAYFSTLREEGNAEIYTLTFIEPQQAIADKPRPPVKHPGQPRMESDKPSDIPDTKTVASAKPTPPTKTTKPAAKTTKTSKPKSTTKKTTPKATQYAPAKPVDDANVLARKYLFFNKGDDELNNQSVTKLKDVVAMMKQEINTSNFIEGHTDNTGSEILNYALSVKRANAVARYLTVNGVDPTRIAVKGYGSKRPIVSNDDEKEGREVNRRIEMVLTR